MKTPYVHGEIPELTVGFLDKGSVQVGCGKEADHSRAIEIALAAMKLAVRLGVQPPSLADNGDLPYDDHGDTLLFQAPMISAMAGQKMLFLRGWKQFESCIKGFNTLGLMAEHLLNEISRLKKLPSIDLKNLKMQFLRTRRDIGYNDLPGGLSGGKHVFADSDLQDVTDAELLQISMYDLAIWYAFSDRLIVCSTSSNMGISTHQVLRLMQKVRIAFKNRNFGLLNRDEGRLVIWCPDKRADFMNEEKTRFLSSLEEDLPQITRLRTYINRQQRDPGALRDALLAGGYFFPTNPQSKEEMQNLIFMALTEIANEQSLSVGEVIQNEKIKAALATLGCKIQGDHVVVENGVEGGIYGLMLPYIIMLDEFLNRRLGSGVSLWNPSSIGAAFAASALADKILKDPASIRDDLRGELNSFYPSLSSFLDSKRLGKNLKTRLHGVFDIANLQSLAQLLGVVVENHLSGRGTAYVGLGSSSYSNGNRCYEILKDSIDNNGAFRGKTAFHPATHTINPCAQALIFGEDLYRFLIHRQQGDEIDAKTLAACARQVKKPEPAGAAALAGYLLARLDAKTLSIIEIAYTIRLMGFSRDIFLEFAGFDSDSQGIRTYIQQAHEEGIHMGSFAKNIMLLLEWRLKDLEREALAERMQSLLRHRHAPLDDYSFDGLNAQTCVQLSGDNTQQPQQSLYNRLAAMSLKNRSEIANYLSTYASLPKKETRGAINLACIALYRSGEIIKSFGDGVELSSQRIAGRLLGK